MNGATTLLALLSAQRGVELAIARKHTRALLARGAYESDAGQYPVMVTLHATWLATLWLWGRERRVKRPYAIVFGSLQIARWWVLRTLGERWTTRIIILPGAAPITSGPYRFLRHPNYAVVAGELPCVSLALGLRAHALVFGLANLAMLAWRIRAEDHAYTRERAAVHERVSAAAAAGGASSGGASRAGDDDERAARS